MMELLFKILISLVVLIACCQHNRVHCQAIRIPAPECYDTTTCPCCSVPCPSDGTGQCNGNCKNGYHGGKCLNKCPDNCIRCVDAQQVVGVANCTQCKDGYYSTASHYQCQSACPSNCKTCESATHCTSCQHGYYLNVASQCAKCAETCETCSESSTLCTSCKVGFYLNEADASCLRCNQICYSCNSSQTCSCFNGCDMRNGRACTKDSIYCQFGCKSNFTSSVAQHSSDEKKYICDICMDNLYGVQCEEKCSTGCNSSSCERLSGKCYNCKVGYYGDTCQLNCSENCLDSCNRNSGQCDYCKDGFYGVNCTMECIDNCTMCVQTNGSCTRCKGNRFYGINCTESCPPNCTYGTCNMTGHCDILPTTTSPPTTTVVSKVPLESSSLVGPAAGGTVAAVLVVAIVVGLVVIIFRRRSVSSFKGNFNVINLDDYNLRLIDVLEENDEFDPTYFSGKVSDKKKPCGKLPVKELAYFVDTHGELFYQEEFLKLPRGLIKPCEDAKIEKNIIKNRYNGVYPYDEHRVKLYPPGSDFINACYIDGFKTKKEYIASLGPTRKAMEGFHSFWRMVWQEKSDVIVMVTNLMEGQSMKCEQYWPDEGQSCCYGDITVTSLSSDFFSEFVVRKMTVSMGKEHRTLHHLHYTAWPDKRVPDDISSLLEFRQKVKTTESALGGPIIVHCSAGIGRTGTYIALDILIHQGKAEKSLDIFEWVTRMRDQRTSMVQTWQQYEFLHRALVHALTYHSEPIKQSKFQRYIDSLTDKHLKALSKQMTKLEKPAEGEEEARNINKGYEGLNREGADIPGLLNRPLLNLGKRFGECNYINAVYLNSYTVKDRFLVCQTPLPDTVEDFLTLITQESCACIVSMDPPGLKGPTIGNYFSRMTNKTFHIPSGLYEVETQELDKNPSYILRKLIIQHNQRNSESTSMTVYHYKCQHWPQGNSVPDVSHFLQLVQDVDAMADRSSGHGPVLVHCLNAAERSGLFCAVSNLIQKMRVEGEVSVVNTLRQVKVRRPLAIPNKEQNHFSYQAVQQFLIQEESVSETAIYCNV